MNGQPTSEEEYWGKIETYNADGSYAFPVAPINADQVHHFWMRVAVSDEQLEEVQRQDHMRHCEVEQELEKLHSRNRIVQRGRRTVFLPPLTPDLLQQRVDTLAAQRRYRKHPELLEHSADACDLAAAIQQTNELIASVPPRRIPTDQLRMAARVGKLIWNAQGLRDTERNALWDYEVVFMGQRQRITSVYNVWRPDQIV